ncbi:FAD-dependent oxidoreductase [Hymenobacter aerilatus]|uniref:FAD-dependent oxidoreductase n=1 Tax=Hymenobacter aerilatus TaxID=2932251 RepID=A0A8T9SSI5_9BACT|nr:NAD(P)/FAD-dependent oxidoreductase [Hymenobacter aerilatus]UOR04717.1 FAD-dependent oxidoreductase [Hymenobacter aerilatus]
MATSSASLPVIIIGAGMAGLTCANYLYRAGKPVLVLEAADAVGGRVRTDITPEGFRLDRGFQILLTRYPEVQRLMDYGALDLRAFQSGAVIQLHNGRETTLINPLRKPLAAFEALTSPIGSLADKLRIANMVRHVSKYTAGQLLSRNSSNQEDTLAYLCRNGFSERIIDTFFRPFFGGVFLDRQLRTAANFFEFVFQQFVVGDAAVPNLGIQVIPEQLAARLPTGSVRLNSPVSAVEGTHVRLWTDEVLEASAVVIATDGAAAQQLLPTSSPSTPTSEWRKTTCTYFAAPYSPGHGDKLLRLNAMPGALAHNVVFPSDAAPGYAPTGQTLISVNTHGAHGLTEEELLNRLRAELAAWFGPATAQWQHLRTYEIVHALPAYPAGQPYRQSLRLADNLYQCGDYTAYPSLNAAMATGREVAEMLLV